VVPITGCINLESLCAGRELSKIIPEISDQAGFLRNITLGYQMGAAFFYAFHKGMFTDLLVPRGIEELCRKYTIPREKTSLLLGMFVSGNVLLYKNGKYQVRSELIPFLDPSSPLYVRWLDTECNNRFYWADLEYYLRHKPKPPSPVSCEYPVKKDEITSMGMQALLGRLQGIVTILQEFSWFSSSRCLLDLGGGHGFIGIACAQANPEMKVVIYDRPSVIQTAWESVCFFGVEERVVCVGGDYTCDRIGSGYDIVLHICPADGPPDNDQKILSAVRG